MNLFSRLWQRDRQPNITVYYVNAIIDGNVNASPLGIIPRLSDEYEQQIKRKHRPVGTTYINETIDGVSVILCWTGRGVDAISFLSIDDARAAFPAIREFPAADLVRLDSVLPHFPR